MNGKIRKASTLPTPYRIVGIANNPERWEEPYVMMAERIKLDPDREVAGICAERNCVCHWRMARMGEGDSRMEGIEMVERAVFIPRRKVAWRRVPS